MTIFLSRKIRDHDPLRKPMLEPGRANSPLMLELADEALCRSKSSMSFER